MTNFRLEEICSLITDGKHGDCVDQSKSGFFFLSCKDIRDGKMNYDNPREITEIDFRDTHRRTNLSPGDVLITNSGTIGRLAVAPNHPYTFKTTFQKSVAIIKPKPEIVDSYYLYYYLHYKNRDLVEFAGGTTQKNLLLKDIRAFEVKLPTLEKQKSVSQKLTLLDSKININSQMNETLESMAKAIFNEWFIDFGPVKAKAEGKKPFGMDDETAALFPDSFEESELGMIPKGWEVKTLGESCSILMGQSPPGDTYNETGNGMVFYQGRAEFGSRYPSPRLFCSEPSRIVNAGTVLLSVRAPVGDLNISTEEKTCIGRGLAGILHKVGGPTFTYYLLQSLKDKFDMYNGEGTVFGSINKDTLSGLKIISPPEVVLNKFLDLVRPMDNLYFSNFIESRALTQTRDLLLPKLISGELQLNEVTSD